MKKIFALVLASSVYLTTCDKVPENNASQVGLATSSTTANDG